MPAIAVAILNWNGKHFLERFLPQLLAHTSQPDVSFVVIDNGSIDGSVDFLRAHFPSITLICLDKNYGFTGGYNRGLQQVEADYYVLLNSDVEVTANWLQPLLALMEQDAGVGACMPKICATEARGLFEYAGAAGGFIDKYGYPFCRGRILSHIEPDTGQYDERRAVFWATGACMMVRAALYHRLGGFDALFFAHMEEIDLCWRMQAAGYKIMCEPQSVVFHVGGGTLPNNHPQKIYFNHRNNLYLLYKNLPAKKRKTILAARMALDGLSAMAYLCKGKCAFFAAVLRAHFHFWRNHRKLLFYNNTDMKISGVYAKSIVWKFFTHGGKLRFSDLISIS
ncbi:MAG: glycosyltransferase family 2 protein [Prevotellaceae bacterium]|jgi:GT2 family glycosyltransferase|nr:glycosyltransferase family 2 protein [Prevotellaceae bacterium]